MFKTRIKQPLSPFMQPLIHFIYTFILPVNKLNYDLSQRLYLKVIQYQ